MKPDQVIAKTIWTAMDLLEALENSGYKANDNNVKLILEGQFIDRLEEAMVEEGWNIISYMFSNVFGLEEVEENIL